MLKNILSLIHGSKKASGAPPQKPSELLFFLHIPKTAGTAITDSLRAFFPSDRVFPSYSENDVVRFSKGTLREQYDFVHAHAGANVAFSKVSEPSHVFTVLRDPTSRILSLYNYWRSVRVESATVFEGGLVDPAVTLAKSKTFEDFIFSDHQRILNDLENGQVYQLALSNTDQGRMAAKNMTPQEILDLAWDNLLRMGVVGVTEDLDAFSTNMEQRYGIQIAIENRNVTKERFVKANEIGRDAKARIEALTELDHILYDRVRSRLLA